MIIPGIFLLLIGIFAGISILTTIGVFLVVLAVVMYMSRPHHAEPERRRAALHRLADIDKATPRHPSNGRHRSA